MSGGIDIYADMCDWGLYLLCGAHVFCYLCGGASMCFGLYVWCLCMHIAGICVMFCLCVLLCIVVIYDMCICVVIYAYVYWVRYSFLGDV